MSSIETTVLNYDRFEGRKIWNRSLKWCKRIGLPKNHGTLISKIKQNPYIITPIPLQLADRLLSLSDLPRELHHEAQWMGELLRRCHYVTSDKLYSSDGKGKNSYEQNNGIVIGSDEFNKLPYRPDAMNLIHKYKVDYNLVCEITQPNVWIVCCKHIAYVEQYTADYLCNNAKANSSLLQVTKDEIIDTIKESDKVPTDELVSAINTSLHSPVSVITGEGGTGKTLAIQIIHKLCIKYAIGFRVCAFTGKAITNIKDRYLEDGWDNSLHDEYFTTMHSLLYAIYKPYIRELKGKFPREFPWQSREGPFVLIIEEASMIPTWLVSSLFRQVSKIDEKNLHLILVGDNNQLPPIGWGKFFDSLLRSDIFPISTLTENFRTQKDAGKSIIPNARQFKQDSPICNLIWENYFIKLNDDDNQSTAIDMCLNQYKHGYNNMIIISPWRNRVSQINKRAQQILHSENANYIEYNYYSTYRWYVDDKVIITKNSKEEGVYNGSDGVITDINTSRNIMIDETKSATYQFLSPYCNTLQKIIVDSSKNIKYNNRKYTQLKFKELNIQVRQISVKVSNKTIHLPIQYEKKDEDDVEEENSSKQLAEYLTIQHLDLAYALTTHKIQGSERKIVVLDCNSNYPASCIPGGKANIYTAMTRAKEHFFYIGDVRLLYEAHGLVNKTKYNRLPYLLQRLKG